MKTKPPIVDAHVHIFPPEMISRREALLSEDLWFNETYGHPAAKMRTGEELIARMDSAGVDISVVVGWPWRRNEHCSEHNDYLAACAARWPDRIIWLGIVNPTDTGAIEEVDRCASLGAAGFGELNADGQGFSWSEPDQYLTTIRQVASHHLPIMTHTSEPVGHLYPGKGMAHPREILTAIEAIPEARWVLAHWGGGLPFYELMPEVRELCQSVAYDSAATSFLYDSAIFRHVIDLVGVEKVLFGSDWPVLGQAKLIQRIRDAELSDEELAAVLGGNALRIYGRR